MSNVLEEFTYSTLQLIVEHQDRTTSCGTGFLFAFEGDVICLVTNKHVISGYKTVRATFTRSDGTRVPLFGQNVPCDITACLKTAVYHPDEKVDLVAIPIALIVREAEKNHVRLFLMAYTINQIPNEEDRKNIFPGNEAFMIGYPLSLIDSANNLPIVRKGSIATKPTLDFNGDRCFLVDVSIQKGSSGSPVVARYYRNCADHESGRMRQEEGCLLLGIIYGSYESSISATLRVGALEQETVLNLRYPTNLAFAIPSWCLLELNELIKNQLPDNPLQ